jgi:protein-S-isoprenylcysteine O-methyltransferase Ste14
VSIGFLFVASGEAVRFWAAGHLLKSVELVTSGPYRYTRNPLYLGRLLILTGICIMAKFPFEVPGTDGFLVPLNLVVLVIGYAVFFGYYLPRKERVEPDRLREIHGEAFERYFRAVPALLPTFRPYRGGTGSGWSSDRMLRNREHWMVIGLAILTLFLLWRSYQLQV